MFSAIAQNNTSNPPGSGSFLLHKFAQNIGQETYTIKKQGNHVRYDVNFKFVDRGLPVATSLENSTFDLWNFDLLEHYL